MSRYRKKPVVIDAFKINKDGSVLIMPTWLFNALQDGIVKTYENHFTVQTLEGEMLGQYEDWIIKGVKGELYPCKPDIFEMTYEPEESC